MSLLYLLGGVKCGYINISAKRRKRNGVVSQNVGATMMASAIVNMGPVAVSSGPERWITRWHHLNCGWVPTSLALLLPDLLVRLEKKLKTGCLARPTSCNHMKISWQLSHSTYGQNDHFWIPAAPCARNRASKIALWLSTSKAKSP